ncbi:MAG: hypothetical protein ACI89L_001282 [Phycisphaerales bacterium]|jgi:hypothetical protein
MNRDLTEILKEWPYEPGELHVRLIEGTDDEPKLQVRLDLGILQMNAEGRPDGEQPFGYDSLLEYHEARLDGLEPDLSPEEADAADGEDESDEADNDGDEPEGDDEIATGSFEAPDVLDADELGSGSAADQPKLTGTHCRGLRDEALQYYHRYVALLVLEDFEGVVRDTTRNLRVLELMAEHAESENDRTSLESHRPYILMMRARAMASQAIKDSEPKLAILALDQGLEALRAAFDKLGDAEGFDSSKEAEMLRSMREALVPMLPVSQKAELRRRLNEAIMDENYELAAILRDEIRLLPE